MMVLVIPAQIALWVFGVFDPWILIPLLVAPLLLARAREVLVLRDPRDPLLSTLTPRTGQIHLLFSVLLCLGVALARL